MTSRPADGGAGTVPAAATAMRLNRFLARAGVASRRASDALIQAGLVRVNGAVALHPGMVVDAATDAVECRGRPVRLPSACEYIVFHKPAGCLVTRRDQRGRRTIYEYFAGLHPGTVAVGRLDQDTTGLLLLTDDGELAFRLMHPRYAVEKEYEATVDGVPAEPALERLRQGVELEDGWTAPAAVRLLGVEASSGRPQAVVLLGIHEGRKRQVRRMLRAVGHPVRRLHRRAFGGLALDLEEPGTWRRLAPPEIAALRSRVGLPAQE